jgi:hypothetical protein
MEVYQTPIKTLHLHLFSQFCTAQKKTIPKMNEISSQDQITILNGTSRKQLIDIQLFKNIPDV